MCFTTWHPGVEGAFEVKYRVPFGGLPAVPGPGVPYYVEAGAGPGAKRGRRHSAAKKPRSAAPQAGTDTRHMSLPGASQVDSKPPVKDSVWNFAYGANMSSWKLQQRRKITPLEAIPGALPGHRLAFNHRGGMGNVVAASSSADVTAGIGAVHGVLLLVKEEDFAKLCRMEDGYDAVSMTVTAYDGRRIVAQVFVSKADQVIVDGLPPSERYKQLLLDGANEFQLDDSYTQWLAALDSIHPSSRGEQYYRKVTPLPPTTHVPYTPARLRILCNGF